MSGTDQATPPESEIRTVGLDGIEFRVSLSRERRDFWDAVAASQWEPQTFNAFRKFLDPNCCFLDIGAWIGPTALYAAHFARHVYAIEPDPVAYAELAKNILLNPCLRDRITLCKHCITAQPGPVKLYSGGVYFNNNSQFGDSMSSILPMSAYQQQPSRIVDGIPLDQLMEIRGVTDCNAIKMDVEGGEYILIPGHWHRLAAYGMPTLFLSFHTPHQSERERMIMACLDELRGCYKYLYFISNRALIDLEHTRVTDWMDDSPGSPWRTLEYMLHQGIVASNLPWT